MLPSNERVRPSGLLPSWELFRKEAPTHGEEVLPPGVPRLAVEAASPIGWQEWSD